MHTSPHHYLHRGVTLIEMLLVLAIVATLVGITVPHYSDYQQTQVRKEATRHLIQLQAWVETRFITTEQYPTESDSAVLEEHALCPDCQLSTEYQFRVYGGKREYKITATPREDSQQRDDPCGQLVLYPNGLVTTTASSTSCPLPQRNTQSHGSP
ncbi:type IV pilin protein [Salinivibrio sp. ES.052]|uniref:type IV pilin protein n=1 Tax=Salinivibrio sp. ES.052 TaxID=1882823 RepID=UPI0009273E71|nr:type IV pilin protein [Salinivibrio sp. ES.052]SIN73430.1 prepilin-type N-terminal cleavage/methylation domain-containing protein [Salinivibrio sp. ES.052]